MTLAQDLGIEELKAACEDFVVSTLSVTNACTYLSAVMEIQEKSSSKCIVNLNVIFIFHYSYLKSILCSIEKKNVEQIIFFEPIYIAC